MIPEAVAWLDGGGMTGMAVLLNHGQQFWAGEHAFLEACSLIERACAEWGRRLAIGWERYDIRPRMPQTHAYDAIGINRVAEFLAYRHGCQILKPAQQHTPDAAERRELQAIGWWTPAKNDAQSAACHMLRWLRRENLVPARERAILSELSVH